MCIANEITGANLSESLLSIAHHVKSLQHYSVQSSHTKVGNNIRHSTKSKFKHKKNEIMIKIDDFKVPWVKNTIMLYIGLSMVIKENMQQAVASLRVRHLPAGFFFFFFLDLSSEGVDKTFSMF